MFPGKSHASIIRILIGLFFIGSAITKLISIDSFEIFIYSFGIFNLSTALLFARFVISIEVFIGILLIPGIYTKKVIEVTIGLLAIFSLFILYLIFGRSNLNCHCFGDLFELSNISSLIKNIVIIILLLVIRKSFIRSRKYSIQITSIALVVTLALPLVISPPDSFYYSRYSDQVTYNNLFLKKFLDENREYASGKRVLCFYSTSCRFCRLASQKISVIANKTGKVGLIDCIFWVPKKSVDQFYTENNSLKFNYKILEPDVFLRITNGEMPAILLLKDGEVIGKYGYRSINENQLINFLKD